MITLALTYTAGVFCFFVFLVFLFRVRLSVYALWPWAWISKDDPRPRHADLLRNIRDILQPTGSSLQTLLAERAYANKRLVRALGLSNTFVSDELDVHTQFVSRARRLLNVAQKNGWGHFQAIAREAVRWQFECAEREPNSSEVGYSDLDEYPFDQVIQNVTLFVVLQGIFQIDGVAESSYEDVDIVSSSITKLWALSKKPEPIPPHLLEDLTVRLRRLVPDQKALPEPLNFIVPTWETLWRVVATTVAYSHDSEDVRRAFRGFNDNPNDTTYREVVPGEENAAINVKSVVTEALRLNPPSKRIGRSKAATAKWCQCPSFLAKWIPRSIVKADIEALMHSDIIWGPDAQCFHPSRHIPESEAVDGEQRREAMSFVFGHGTLKCIAASWAPVAAAVIAGVVLDEYEVLAGKDIGEREGWQGWRLRRRDSR